MLLERHAGRALRRRPMEDPPPLLIFPLRCAVARASFRPVAKLPTEEAWCRFGAALRVVAELVAVADVFCVGIAGQTAPFAAQCFAHSV